MNTLFNYQAILSSKNLVRHAPGGFRYGFISPLFSEVVFEELRKSFPTVSRFKEVDKQSGGGRKHFFVGPVYDASKHWGCTCHLAELPDIWQRLIVEASSPRFIDLIETVTGVGLNSMCTFGFTYGREGCVQEPHLDGAIRSGDKTAIHSTLACLLYFNENSASLGGTEVYAPDRKTVLFQAPNLRNSLLFFEQHHLAWHGFPPLGKGTERYLVSLAFSQEAKPIKLKASILHKLTCINAARLKLGFARSV